MLFELPTAEEIDELAITTPTLEVRKFEFDMSDRKADLNYRPCKGQVVLVIAGRKGTVLARRRDTGQWTLPTGRIGADEGIAHSAKRVARQECGLALRSIQLAAMYDVVWHYADVSVKRLHIVYAAITENEECKPEAPVECVEPGFHREIPGAALMDDITRFAIADSLEKSWHYG